ncbi:MAG: sigma 54-interacting transcriptional regulator, partial [Phycisphaerales bacterium]
MHETTIDIEREALDLLDAAPDAILIVDDQGRIVHVNAHVEPLLGWSAHDLVGGPVELLLPERFRKAHVRQRSQFGKSPRVRAMGSGLELRALAKDDREIPVEVSLSPLETEQGLLVISSIRDITARKRAEEVHRLDEARLEALVKLYETTAAPFRQAAESALEHAVKATRSKIGFVGLLDDDESVLTIHAWSEGVMRECSVAGQPRVLHVAEAGLWSETIRQRKPIVVNDYVGLDRWKKGYPQGHVPLSRFLGVPIFDGERIVAVVAVANKEGEYEEGDVRQLTLLIGGIWRFAQHQRAEEAVRESRTFLQTIIDGIPEAVLVIDRDYRVVLANRATRELAGLEDPLARDAHCYEVSHGRDSRCTGTEHPCPLHEVVATKDPVTVTHTHLDRDGNEIIVEILAAPIFDTSGEVVQIVESCRDITERRAAEAKLEEAFDEITRLKDRLEAENVYLRQEVRLEHAHDRIVGASPRIKAVLSQVEQVGPTDSTVLLLGETGTGKELIAHAIHALGARRERAMVHVNCAALPATLVESELFGREKGAYTGALSKQVGRFEVADKSTILLDEIAELPLDAQAKLLRVLQEGQFERLGSSRTMTVDVRVIAATNRDLSREVREGGFREDLYYRLNIFQILVPPLRERLEDVPQLVWAFVDEFSKSMGKNIEAIAQTSMEALQRHHWPGNVRELRNVIERAMIVCTGPTLRIPVPALAESTSHTDMTLES